PVFLKVDWDKWVDEDDEQDTNVGNDMDDGDIDFSKLNMGGGNFDGDAAYDDEAYHVPQDMTYCVPVPRSRTATIHVPGNIGPEVHTLFLYRSLTARLFVVIIVNVHNRKQRFVP
ncbi:hypothetical protein ACR2V4_26865, partial [Klebsiella pneumoniae]